MNIPENLRYTKDHEWVRVEGDTGTIGVTDFAQGELGDVVFVELPQTGRTLKSHETFGTVEAVKAVADLFAPVSGTVTAVNEALAATPEIVNKDPYGAGWMIRVQLADPKELDGLMDAQAYQAHTGK
jgi:glycine cleavage system H protein